MKSYKREVLVCNQSSFVSFDKRRLVRLLHVLDSFMPANMRAPKGELSIAIMDDAALAKIHTDFLDDPTKTDVITFEGDAEEDFAGEICVSAERALHMASKFSNTPDLELCLYIAHGTLHLAGIDDIAPEDALKMREAEAIALQVIKSKFRKAIFHFKSE